MTDPIVPPPASPTIPHGLSLPPPFLPDGPIRPFPWWKIPPELTDVLDEAATRGIGDTPQLSENDRTILRNTANSIRRLRREFATTDDRPGVARRLISVLAYATGFCDARHIVQGSSALTQAAAAQSAEQDFDALLAEVEAVLRSLSDPTRTGLLLPDGVLLVGIGIALKVIADAL